MNIFGIEIKKAKPVQAVTEMDPTEAARVIGSVINPWEISASRGWLGTPEDYLKFVNAYKSWIYICANKNATAVAEAPIRLYVAKPSSKSKMYFKTARVEKQKKDRIFKQGNLMSFTRNAEDIEEILEHPFLDMIKNVNPLINRFDLWELTEIWLELTGNAYWYVWRDNIGAPKEIWPIPPQYMQVVASKETIIAGYFYQRGTMPVPFDYGEIIHFKFMSPRGSLYGQGPLSAIIDTYEGDQAIKTFEKTLMQNAGRPEGVLETDSKIAPEVFKRLKEDWAKNYAGVSKVGKTLILENGLTYKPLTFTPREMNYVVGRKMNREEIAAAFGVPMSKLTTDSVNRANAREGNWQYANDTVEPRLRRLEEKINERLMPMYDDNIFVAYDTVVPEDEEFLLRTRESNLTHYLTTVNEERKGLGKEEVEWGKTPLAPAGIAPLGSQPAAPGSPSGQPGGDNEPRVEEEELDETDETNDEKKKPIKITKGQLNDLIKDVVNVLRK